MSSVIKVLHVITSLEVGGAETMLYRLLPEMNSDKIESRVVCLTGGGVISEKITSLGIVVEALNIKRGKILSWGLWKLSKIVRLWKPDIIQTWLYHSDLMGWIAGKVLTRSKVVWNIRCSYIDFDHYSILTRIVKRICKTLSPWTDAIIANSNSAYEHHARYGYRPRIFEIIRNGLDTTVFTPNEAKRKVLRERYSIRDDECLVGVVGRFDHMKGYEMFCEAAGRLFKRNSHVRYIMCGKNIDESNEKLCSWLMKAGIKKGSLLMGHQENMDMIYPAMDIVASTSIGEGFPNVVAEAMACGVPCVVTNVGDSAYIVKDAGVVIPVDGDTTAMVNAWEKVVEMPPCDRRELGRRARERICSLFQIQGVAKKYEELYDRVLNVTS